MYKKAEEDHEAYHNAPRMCKSPNMYSIIICPISSAFYTIPILFPLYFLFIYLSRVHSAVIGLI